MTNHNNENHSEVIQGNIFLSQNAVDDYDLNMRDITAFLMDIGTEVIACHLATKSALGYIVFSYDVYTKNIFDLLEIDLDAEELKEEYVLVYRFETTKVLNEHIKRITNLFRKYT